jgi:hypothetical protein
MPVTEARHQIDAYTIEASGNPVATIKATSVLDAMRFVLDFDDLTSDGRWDGEEPVSIRKATWLEKDAVLSEGNSYGKHFLYWHTRETTNIEEANYNARSQPKSGLQPFYSH